MMENTYNATGKSDSPHQTPNCPSVCCKLVSMGLIDAFSDGSRVETERIVQVDVAVDAFLSE